MPKKPSISPFALAAESALRGYLATRLAPGASVDLRPVVRGLDARKFGAAQHAQVKVALDAALKPGKDGQAKLAADADVADVQEVLAQLDDLAPQIADMVVGGVEDPDDQAPPGPGPDLGAKSPIRDEADPTAEMKPPPDAPADTMSQVLDFLKDKLSPEDLAALQAIIKPKDAPAMDDKKPITAGAMDAAISAAVNAATKRLADQATALRVAERAVLPYVGQVQIGAMDSADAVYEFALKKLGVDTKGVHASAFPALLKVMPVPGARPRVSVVGAADSAAKDTVQSRFGDAATRLKSA